MQSAAIKPLRNKQVAFPIYTWKYVVPSVYGWKNWKNRSAFFQIDEENREGGFFEISRKRIAIKFREG